MKYVEYGKEHTDVIVLLHGGGLSWWNYREAAQMLQSRYHVVLPILDGHSGSDRVFSSIEDNAAALLQLIDERFGGRVLLLGGLSLGGQLALEMLSQRSDICRYALIESALVKPSKLVAALIKPALNCSCGLIQQRWFSKLQFQSLRMKQELFEDYYRDSCQISKADMTAFLQANARYFLKDSLTNCCAEVHICVGERENSSMRKSAEMIQRKLPGSSLQILPQFYHGEFSLNHSIEYVNKINEILSSERRSQNEESSHRN